MSYTDADMFEAFKEGAAFIVDRLTHDDVPPVDPDYFGDWLDLFDNAKTEERS